MKNGDFCYKIRRAVDKQLGSETNSRTAAALVSPGRRSLYCLQIDEVLDHDILVGTHELVV